MNLERARSVLGVWAPMTIGLFIIVTSLSFYFTATLTGNVLTGELEPWRLICSAGAFFVGGLLIFSTYGRCTKRKEWRRRGSPETALLTRGQSREEKPDHGSAPGARGASR